MPSYFSVRILEVPKENINKTIKVIIMKIHSPQLITKGVHITVQTTHSIGNGFIKFNLVHSYFENTNPDGELDVGVALCEDRHSVEIGGIKIPPGQPFEKGLHSLGIDFLAEIRKIEVDLSSRGMEEQIIEYVTNTFRNK